MAKYSSTPIPYFMEMSIGEGMAYAWDMLHMAEEEREAIEERTRQEPSLPNVTGWPKSMT